MFFEFQSKMRCPSKFREGSLTGCDVSYVCQQSWIGSGNFWNPFHIIKLASNMSWLLCTGVMIQGFFRTLNPILREKFHHAIEPFCRYKLSLSLVNNKRKITCEEKNSKMYDPEEDVDLHDHLTTYITSNRTKPIPRPKPHSFHWTSEFWDLRIEF